MTAFLLLLVVLGAAGVFVVRRFWADLDELRDLRRRVAAADTLIEALDAEIAATENLAGAHKAHADALARSNAEWEQKCRDLVAITLALDITERTS